MAMINKLCNTFTDRVIYENKADADGNLGRRFLRRNPSDLFWRLGAPALSTVSSQSSLFKESRQQRSHRRTSYRSRDYYNYDCDDGFDSPAFNGNSSRHKARPELKEGIVSVYRVHKLIGYFNQF